MAKVKKNLEKPVKEKKVTNVLKTTDKKNSPKNRVKSVIAKPQKVNKVKKIAKNAALKLELLKHGKQMIKGANKKGATKKEEVAIKDEAKNMKNGVKKEEKKKRKKSTKVADIEVESKPIVLESKTAQLAVDGLFTLLEKNDKVKLFDDQEEPFMLQIKSVKVPKAVPMIRRISLKHSILNANSDVCFIVNDYRKKDADKTVEFYEELFEKQGIKNIKCIMPFHTVSTEYAEYENQRRLVELYDVFLIDASVANKFSKIFRTVFMRKGKMPRMIKMKATGLKCLVEKSLRMVPLAIKDNCDCFNIMFGHSLMKKSEIVENLHQLIADLNGVLPGGHNNIRSLHIKAPTSESIPIYATLKSNAEVSIPVAKRQLPKAFKDVRGELSTFNNAEVIVKPFGEVILVQKGSTGIKVDKDDGSGDEAKEEIDEESNEQEEEEVPSKKIKVDIEEVAVKTNKKKKGKGKEKPVEDESKEAEDVDAIEETKEDQVAPSKKVKIDVEQVLVKTNKKKKGKGHNKAVIAELNTAADKEITLKADVAINKNKKKSKGVKPMLEQVLVKTNKKKKGKGHNKAVIAELNTAADKEITLKADVAINKNKKKSKGVKPMLEAVKDVTVDDNKPVEGSVVINKKKKGKKPVEEKAKAENPKGKKINKSNDEVATKQDEVKVNKVKKGKGLKLNNSGRPAEVAVNKSNKKGKKASAVEVQVKSKEVPKIESKPKSKAKVVKSDVSIKEQSKKVNGQSPKRKLKAAAKPIHVVKAAKVAEKQMKVNKIKKKKN